ncbi:MAG: hypothetical protein ABJH72_22355 [Reichenbachiella sp.]|uniref:hypothetical protein n=1 Tax=Reichenbachiella sp. TaxID=2184521 RepID=UPI003263026F
MKKICFFITCLLLALSANAQFVENTSGNLTTTDKIGIGANFPAGELHIHGSENDGSETVDIVLSQFNGYSKISGLYTGTSKGAIAFSTANGIIAVTHERMRIRSDGNVGIGTINPSEKLQVNGNASILDGNMIFNNSSTNLVESGTIRWNEYSNNITSISGAFIKYDGSSNYLQISTNTESTNYEHLRIYRGGNILMQPNSGSVGIGTTTTGSHKLAVHGSIGAREIKVEATGWSDFVFDDDYELRTLEEVEEHIAENGHLPDIPSESEVTKNGIDLGEMDAKLLQKIEELTLYMIEINKELKEVKALNTKQEEELKTLRNQ